MEVFMNQLAVSLAGHDKGCIYAIIKEDETTVFLADGSARRLEKPKKKNLKHIRRIVRLPAAVSGELEKVSNNSDLVHVRRMYRAEANKEK